MDSMSYNFGLEEKKQTFISNTDTKPLGTESFTAMDKALAGPQESAFSPLAPPFQGRGNSDLLTMLALQEPRAADPAPATTELEDAFMNFRMSGSEMLFDDEQNSQNYYMGSGGSRQESVLTSNIWGDGSSVSSARNGEMMDTFDFLIKTNNYVSMLTREQLFVLRSIRPSLLYDFLQEVTKVRCDRRVRRALPNECAFCKNNGENEECYTSHALKDWRGRVLCPVLRAFRCPRCGATGDRAHTIKYCPENDSMSDRSGRRVLPTSAPLLGNPRSSPSTPAAPVSSPAPSTAGLASFWSTTQLGGPFN